MCPYVCVYAYAYACAYAYVCNQVEKRKKRILNSQDWNELKG